MTTQLNAVSRLQAAEKIEVTAGSWGYGPLQTDGSADMHYELLAKIFAYAQKTERKALKSKDVGNNYNIMPSWVGSLCALMVINYPIDKSAWLAKIAAVSKLIVADIPDAKEKKRMAATFKELASDVKKYTQQKHKFGFLSTNAHGK